MNKNLISSDGYDWYGPFSSTELEQFLTSFDYDPNKVCVWYDGLCDWELPHMEHAVSISQWRELGTGSNIYVSRKGLRSKCLKRGAVLMLLFVVAGTFMLYPKSVAPPCLDCPPCSTPVCKDSVKQQFKKKLIAGGHEGEGWVLGTSIKNDLVKGKPGKYFKLNIRGIKYQDTLLFDVGQYTIDAFNEKFQQSFANFGKALLPYLKGTDYAIFVKGSADIRGDKTFQDTLYPKFNYTKITYLPSIGSSADPLFDPQPQTQFIPNIFGNKELPNLRGQFMKDRLEETFKEVLDGKIPIILGGNVTSREAEIDRNTMILLYIPDSFFKNPVQKELQ